MSSSAWLSSRWGWVTADEISVDDEALRRGDDFQGKKAMVLGSSV